MNGPCRGFETFSEVMQHYGDCEDDTCDICDGLENFLSGCSGCGGVGQLDCDAWLYDERTGDLYCKACAKRLLGVDSVPHMIHAAR